MQADWLTSQCTQLAGKHGQNTSRSQFHHENRVEVTYHCTNYNMTMTTKRCGCQGHLRGEEAEKCLQIEYFQILLSFYKAVKMIS